MKLDLRSFLPPLFVLGAILVACNTGVFEDIDPGAQCRDLCALSGGCDVSRCEADCLVTVTRAQSDSSCTNEINPALACCKSEMITACRPGSSPLFSTCGCSSRTSLRSCLGESTSSSSSGSSSGSTSSSGGSSGSTSSSGSISSSSGGTSSSGSSTTGKGSCTDAATRVCTELVEGSGTAFEAQCDEDGTYRALPCAVTSPRYTCKGAKTTSAGSANVTNIYWPSDFCTRYPNTDLARTCTTLGGTGSGTPCPR